MASSAKVEFEPTRRVKAYEEVAQQIQHKILHGLSPGDLLPPELQLAQSFGVSRGTIRDAIRGLELMGLVDRHQGRGTTVRRLTAESHRDPLSAALVQQRYKVKELLDIRKILEPALARRAAAHVTTAEIDELEQILRRQEEKVQRHELAIEEDCAFHYNIAMAADNGVVLKILDILMDLLRDTREQSLQTEGRLEKSLAGHHRIFAALKRRNERAAEAAMRRHLEEVETIVQKNLKT
jgi:GntR family transcriptional repressor for pyruvate dehydrogenase complex